jgi:plastocyanin
MKTIFISLLVIAALLSGCYGPAQTTGNTAPVSTSTVEISNFAFNPATITVSKGATVTWTQKDDAPHTVTGTGFDSGTLAKGQTFSHTFNDAGTFDYGCSIHSGMRGKVIVAG